MTSRIKSVTGHQTLPLSAWRLASTPPGAIDGPDALERSALTWLSADGPATAAAMLRAQGAFSLEGQARRFDSEDWWFRARLPAVNAEATDELSLSFGGLATVADVWLDGAHLLASDNMFTRHERRVGSDQAGGELTIRCRALDALLTAKRPRPRWRAPMIEHQQLRWFRTTLLGRTPGWSPPAAAVGPWRPVTLERRVGLAVDDLRLGVEVRGETGRVEVACRLRSLTGTPCGPVVLIVERDGTAHRVTLTSDGDRVSGLLEVPRPVRWWPHTHGEPAQYQVHLEVGGTVQIALGNIGFREIAREGEFELHVNGVPIFCRGASWTPLDPVALTSSKAAYHAALAEVKAAGMNLLRVSGTMIYEADDFYDCCDELGILVWQDFMFANMDYPEDEPAFAASVDREVRLELARLQARPSLAVLCGNSEGEQQAAMWGASRALWSPRLFHEVLPKIAGEYCPDVPYWPSSAHGGAFPHQANWGTTSYYGVGAYLRPLTDARRAEVRFASECLAFANVPEPRATPGGPLVRVHHAAWKARTPRDLGAGWDFDDVRDHYLEELFNLDPMKLRYADHERYLALGRVVTGEVMASVFGEWRSKRSTCRGGLVWFLRDLWPSAGWGVVDSDGRPKAAWFYLRRALQPIAIHLSDEGGNGLSLHLVNERPTPLVAEIELTSYRAGELKVASARRPITLAPREVVELPAASCFDGFVDLSYAYRFGPPPQDLVVATLRAAATGELLAQTFHFPLGLPSARELDLGLVAEAKEDEQSAHLSLRTRRFAQSIAIDCEGFIADDDYFHLPPGGERTIRLRRTTAAGPLRGTVHALNAEAATRILVL